MGRRLLDGPLREEREPGKSANVLGAEEIYSWVQRLSTIQTFENFTGFGLYDRKVVEAVRSFDDPYPYFRGLIAEIGLPHASCTTSSAGGPAGSRRTISYAVRHRNAGRHEPIQGPSAVRDNPRIRLFSALPDGRVRAYFIYKLLFWSRFTVGVAPLVIGLFFLGSVQLLSMGILGEYIGAIHTNVQRRPYVIEREHIDFEYEPGEPAADPAVEPR